MFSALARVKPSKAGTDFSLLRIWSRNWAQVNVARPLDQAIGVARNPSFALSIRWRPEECRY
jgi:hypothetical protein